jgi:LL-H family phage holin
MNDVTSIILKIVVGILFAIITRYLVPYLKTLRDDARWKRLIDMVETAVLAAEQTVKDPKSGPEKKEMVLKFVSDWFVKQGIDVTAEELDKLIEAAVKTMNDKKVKTPSSIINIE